MTVPAIADVVIVGGGPAGYTAALYAARAGRRPLVFEGPAWGGLLQQTTQVDNFPGFEDGVQGPDLMATLRRQAERHGAVLVDEWVDEVELSSDGGPHFVIAEGERWAARTMILATGATHRMLGVEGEDSLAGRGVSYCATCDAPFFRGVDTVVVGGGDSAMEETLALARFAQHVTVLLRGEKPRASAAMVDRVKQLSNVTLLPRTTVRAFRPGESGSLGTVEIDRSGEPAELRAQGAFVAIGHEPQSLLVKGQLGTDAQGYVEVVAGTSITRVPGVFACGDLVDRRYRQAVTAAASGCQAALDAERYLQEATDLVPGELRAAG